MYEQQLLMDFDNGGTAIESGPAVNDKKYKYRIDKKLLRLCWEEDGVSGKDSKRAVAELKKLINAIIKRHFSNYMYMSRDLMSDALTAVYSKRSYYEPTRDPYNLLYFIIRNTIGNKILKYSKEYLIDSYVDYYNTNSTGKVEYMYDIPKCASKYFDALVGDVDENYVVVPSKDVTDLLLYLKLNEHRSRIKAAPEFVEVEQHSVNVMYNLLKTVIENGQQQQPAQQV